MKRVDLEDITCWEKIIKGDTNAYKVLYEKYVDALFSYGMKFLGREDEVKDAIHDLFLDLYTYKSKLRKDVNVKYYLLFSLKTKIIANCKKKSISLEFQESKTLTFEANQEDMYISFESDSELSRKIHLELNSLPARQKEALYLKYSQDLSYDEVAKLMGVNSATCRTLIYRSIKQLRKNLSDAPLNSNFEFVFK